MLCATNSFCDASRPSSTLSCVVALSRSDVLASLSSTSLFTRPRSRLSCSMATSIWAICALAEATVPRYCVTCVSYSRLSICPSTWPRWTRSPSFTLSDSRSPVTLLLTFTVSRACRWPAAVTTRVTVPFFATEVVTSTGGGAFGRSPITVANATSATTPPARIQRPCVTSLSTLRPAEGRLSLAAVHQRTHQTELRLGELQLRIAHLELRTDADFLTRARQPQTFPGRLFRLLRHPRLRAGGGELGDRLLHVAGDRPPSVHEIVLRQGHLDLRLAHVRHRAQPVEEVPAQAHARRSQAVAARGLEERLCLGGRAAPLPEEGDRRPVIALRGGSELAVLFGGQGERSQAGAIVQRPRDRVRRRRRLGRSAHHVLRLRHGERRAGIEPDRRGEIGAGQFDDPLLPEALHLVVVAVGAGGVDVRLRGAAALEQPLCVVGLVAAAGGRLPEHRELPLRPHQLVEALLDEVGNLQPLLVHLLAARLLPQIGRGEIVPPLSAVEDELAQLQPGGVDGLIRRAPLSLERPRHQHSLHHLEAVGPLLGGTGVEGELRQDGRARDHPILLGGQREQQLPLQVGVPLQREIHGGVERERLRLRDRRPGHHACENQDPEHYAPPPIATLTTSRRHNQADRVPISARRAGTSPTDAMPNAMSTAAQSEKKSTALPSFNAAPETGFPNAARIALRLRGERV